MGGGVELKKISVTADKIEEKVLDVPMSLSVFDGEELEQKQIKDVNDLTKQIPNLNLYKVFNRVTTTYRGLTSSVFTAHNPVIIYVDGVPQSSTMGYNMKLLDVDRVEVIKGPSGSLYGEDAIGGVINIITKKPSNELNGFIGAEYGTNNYMLGKLGINTPIFRDKLYFGLNGLIDKSDGEITNHYLNDKKANSTKEHKVSANLRFTPTDSLDISLQLGNEYNKENWFYGGLVPILKDGYVSRDRNAIKNANFDYPTYNTTKSNSQSLNIKYNFLNLELSWLLAHKKVDSNTEYDTDFSINPENLGLKQYAYYIIDNTTTELRLVSKDSYVRWVAGLFGEIEKEKHLKEGQQFNMGTNFDNYAQGETKSNIGALFGQATTPLGAGFELTLGARFVVSKKKTDFKSYYDSIGGPQNLVTHFVDDKTENVFLPRIALLYKINENFSSYLNISRGYMAGGFNTFPSSDDKSVNEFKAQTSINYELGMKVAYKYLNLGANIFYMDIKDIHTYETINRSTYITSNAPKARSYGAELEFDYAIGDFLVDGGFGLLQTEYVKHVDPKLDGNKIQNSPTHIARIGLGYYSPIGIYARIDLRNRGEVYFDDKNTLKDKNYITVDAKLGYVYKDLEVYLYGKNLNDAKYVEFARIKNENAAQAFFGQSRQFGIGAEYKF